MFRLRGAQTVTAGGAVRQAAEGTPEARTRPGISRRVLGWIQRVHEQPELEEQAAEERRAKLLEELSRAVADAPDDMPIRDVIARLNHHADD